MDTMNMDFNKPTIPYQTLSYAAPPPYSTPPYSAPGRLPQMVIVTQPGFGQARHVRYKCLFLVCVILDLIETIALGLCIVIAFFAAGFLQSALNRINSIPYEAVMFTIDNNNQFSVPTADLEGGILWTIRVILVIVLVVLIKIQMYGWQGYSHYNVCSIYGFVTFKVLSSIIGIVVLLLSRFNLGAVVFLAIKGSSVIISILFAQQVSKPMAIV